MELFITHAMLEGVPKHVNVLLVQMAQKCDAQIIIQIILKCFILLKIFHTHEEYYLIQSQKGRYSKDPYQIQSCVPQSLNWLG